MGLGVSACATCDGFFFKGKDVVVVGGGNTAVEEALFLSNLCKKVTLVQRRDQLRAEQILQKRLGEKKNVEILWNSVVDKIIGNKSKRCISSVKISNNLSMKKKELDLDGIFVAIGHSPTTEVFREFVDMDEEGYILTEPNSTKTNIEGIFAAGDVADKVYRQAVTAAGLGCMGAMEAKTFLNDKKII